MTTPKEKDMPVAWSHVAELSAKLSSSGENEKKKCCRSCQTMQCR